MIEEIKESIEFITDAKSANEFASHINEFEHVGSSLMKARSLFAAKVNSLGLVFDKETKNLFRCSLDIAFTPRFLMPFGDI
ncbi:hypothetical protein NXW84_01120 [Bacteroides fragilis]|nr:hypothetical protein NXW84_01120 [Bacteroides fragilis]